MNSRTSFTPDFLRKKSEQFVSDAEGIENIIKSIETKLDELTVPFSGAEDYATSVMREKIMDYLKRAEEYTHNYAKLLGESAKAIEEMEKMEALGIAAMFKG